MSRRRAYSASKPFSIFSQRRAALADDGAAAIGDRFDEESSQRTFFAAPTTCSRVAFEQPQRLSSGLRRTILAGHRFIASRYAIAG